DRGGLLTDRQVDEARYLTVAVQRGHAFLEAADHEHAPVHLEQVGLAEHEPCSVLTGTKPRVRGRSDRHPADPPRRRPHRQAARGLGRLLARAFAERVARVALAARAERDLKTVAAELPGPSLVCSGAVTDRDFNEAVPAAPVAEFGGIRAWICNAGLSPILGG